MDRLRTENAELSMKLMNLEHQKMENLLNPTDPVRNVQKFAPTAVSQKPSAGAGEATAAGTTDDQLSQHLTRRTLRSPAILFVGDRTMAALRRSKSDSNLTSIMGGIEYVV